MSRGLALVLSLLAAPALADAAAPRGPAKDMPAEKPAARAPAAAQCGKMVDHMWELAKADMLAKLEEKDRAAALAKADETFRAERDQWVEECAKDPTLTEESARCVLTATAADQIDKCMEPAK